MDCLLNTLPNFPVMIRFIVFYQVATVELNSNPGRALLKKSTPKP